MASSTTTTTSSTATATVAALRAALSHNLRVQSEVVARIREIAVRKRDNRIRASDAMLRLQREWREEDRRRTPVDRPPRPRRFYVDLTKKLNAMEKRRVETERERQRQRKRRREGGGALGDADEEEEGEIAKARSYRVGQVMRKWTPDDRSDCRRWNLRYFVDPMGSTPEPNSDTIKRRELEGDVASFLEGRRRTSGGKGGDVEKGSGARAEDDSWSGGEVASLLEAVEEARVPRPSKAERAGENAVHTVDAPAGDVEGAAGDIGEASSKAVLDDAGDAVMCDNEATNMPCVGTAPIDAAAGVAGGDDGVDFEKVAELLSSKSCHDSSQDKDSDDNDKTKKRKRGSSGGKGVVATRRRSPSECRDKFLSLTSSTSTSAAATCGGSDRSERWSPEEAQCLAELVGRHDGRDKWDLVASDLDTDRTAWECFRHYQTNLNPHLTKERVWTAEEDELLFKYVAASGPRYPAESSASAGDIARSLFPGDRSARQVYRRANRSVLANPVMPSSNAGGGGEDRRKGGDSSGRKWSEEEERKLVLLMRVYRDVEPSAIKKATAHFPDRDSASVWEKWHRSLNPEYTFRPWTAEEDELLLDAVAREMTTGRTGAAAVTAGDDGGDGGHGRGGPVGMWTEISSQFPSRHPRSLKSRWVHLTTREEGRPLG